MDQQTRSFNVTQKIVSKPCALGCTGNQPRDVGKNRAIPARSPHHSEIGNQCGERIVSNFWSCCRQHSDQRALASVGQSDDANLSEKFEFQLQRPLLAVAPFLNFSGARLRLLR